jgi:amino acid adenylation domain-containing protein
MPVHAVFGWYVKHAPNAPALLCGEEVVSYLQLDERANRFARRLTQLGVGPRSVVGLLTNRSIEAVVAWLATLKCGGVYLPLDPAYPADHLAFIVEDSAPAVLLAERALMEHGLGDLGAKVLALEQELSDSRHEPALDQGHDTDPLAPAYIMYTSGSTGRPKGVIVPHRAIVRLVREQSYCRFSSDEVFLSLAPLAFDACTFEIWGALLNGARLGLVSNPAPSLDEIAEAILRYKVTTLWLTAGLFHAFVDCRLEALKPLRQLLAGGDVLSPVHVRRALEALPGCQLINGYGPTENTTFTCCCRISLEHTAGSVPIGRPIAHTDVYILDGDMRPVADGEVGQLCVGGDGLALGYLNRPQLNAERFVPNPLAGKSGDSGERLYLTGDLVRRRPDGNIAFLGRNDRQVKIDGKRIELDAIELDLRSSPWLSDAVVALRVVAPEIKRIAAFLKPARLPAQSGLAEAVIADMRQRLPVYMIPHEITVVDELPLTVNGKVDRTALLDMKPQRTPAPAGAAPEGERERQIAAIWGRVLGLARVDRSANFFDLGGTSLQMVRIHAEIKKQLTDNVTITDLFAHPRVADLARFLDGRRQTSTLAAAKSRAAQQMAMMQRAQRTVRKTS